MTSAPQILQHASALDLLLEHAQRRIDAVAVSEMNLYHLGLPAKLDDVLGRRTLLALYGVELHPIAFLQSER